MEHPSTPHQQNPIVPLTQPMNVEGDGVTGAVIAMQWDANAMLYLVVPHDGKSLPIWISESKLTRAYLMRTNS